MHLCKGRPHDSQRAFQAANASSCPSTAGSHTRVRVLGCIAALRPGGSGWLPFGARHYTSGVLSFVFDFARPSKLQLVRHAPSCCLLWTCLVSVALGQLKSDDDTALPGCSSTRAVRRARGALDAQARQQRTMRYQPVSRANDCVHSCFLTPLHHHHHHHCR
jgi:hypothetical protein